VLKCIWEWARIVFFSKIQGVFGGGVSHLIRERTTIPYTAGKGDLEGKSCKYICQKDNVKQREQSFYFLEEGRRTLGVANKRG